jgi:HD-GYP domain-containing protein (c-di-GMP phosphodiesterase class II)
VARSGAVLRLSPHPPASSRDDPAAALRVRLERLEAEAAQRQRQLERYAADLREVFKQERTRAQELRKSYKATVLALSNAVEARDSYTGQHAERVAAYGVRIAHAAGVPVDPEIEFGFLLHDVGKLAVPDAILFKPGRLTPEERGVIAKHTEIGSDILRDVEFLGDAKLVVRHHHERWDGAGYPDGLAGETIPAAARVFSIADTLDAMTTDRPYRSAVGWTQAREEIERQAGSQFDPGFVAAYARIPDEAFARLRDSLA